MADLAAADVTVTLQAGTPHNPRYVNGKRVAFVKVTFGDGVKTYPATTGVPMPAASSFGLFRNLDYLRVIDSSVTAYKVTYDKTNASLRLFDAGAELAATDTPALQTFYCEAVGW
jgi:hypothetical protein